MPIKIYLAGAAFRKKNNIIFVVVLFFLYKFTKGSKKIMLYTYIIRLKNVFVKR